MSVLPPSTARWYCLSCFVCNSVGSFYLNVRYKSPPLIFHVFMNIRAGLLIWLLPWGQHTEGKAGVGLNARGAACCLGQGLLAAGMKGLKSIDRSLHC